MVVTLTATQAEMATFTQAFPSAATVAKTAVAAASFKAATAVATATITEAAFTSATEGIASAGRSADMASKRLCTLAVAAQRGRLQAHAPNQA